MSRLILFSSPGEKIWNVLCREVKITQGTKVAYMPSDGANEKVKYRSVWKEWAEENNGRFFVVNNSLRGKDAELEVSKILSSDVLIITGGNTFVLLDRLRKSGLDKAIKKFAGEKDKTILGFSAGAIIMSSTIRMANCGNIDSNELGMSDLTALNLVPFDIFPHYEEKYENVIADYEKSSKQAVRRLANDDFLIVSTED